MLKLVVLLVALSVAAAHKRDGHEGHSHGTGNFWVFSEGKISIVHDGAVIHTIDTPETLAWADTELTEGRHIFANDRTTGNGQVRIFEADTFAAVTDVPVGERPVHIYYLPWRDEIWTHSDAEGHFDVIHSVDHDIVHSRLSNTFQNAGHGKLGYNEDLGGIVFGGNVNDHGVFRIDLSQVGDMTYDPQWIALNGCNGTHGIYYFHSTGNLYLNCLSNTGTWEIDTNGNVVAQYSYNGNLYHPPDHSWLAVVDRAGSVAFVNMESATPDLSNPIIANVANISGGPKFLLEDDHPLAFVGTSLEHIVVIDLDDPTQQTTIEGVGAICDTCYSRTIEVANDGSYQAAAVSGSDGGTLTLFDTQTKMVTGQVTGLGRIDRVRYVPAQEDSSAASAIVAPFLIIGVALLVMLN